MSATRPAIEFSIGIIASRAKPCSTASKAPSNELHGSGVMFGYAARHARLE